MSEQAGQAPEAKSGRERRRRQAWPPPWPEITDETVRQALAAVPRDRFVPAGYIPWAFDDKPLPIGYGQTISQPFIVAFMTQALRLRPADRVLEVGTGSGYQTAILARLCAHVDSVEVTADLAAAAAERLLALGYGNIDIHVTDGYQGWPPGAPYDAIIVTAAPVETPPALEAQLADGGRLVIPLGDVTDDQTLWLIERQGARLARRPLTQVRFVPLIAQATAANVPAPDGLH